MRAEDTLQYMADFYPDIYPTRKHCLNQLFCVIGNGYKWINGELVDDDNEYVNRYELKESINKAEFRHEEQWYHMHDFYHDLYEDEKQKIPMRYRFEWYPLSKRHSKLFNYPENIKEDWKLLIEECKQMLKSDGINIDEILY